ncbi:MAG: PH domain-containing protein [Thermoleophilia bacterium]|nr:PH domain-containing protein [Thermoleophilia bacterium]
MSQPTLHSAVVEPENPLDPRIIGVWRLRTLIAAGAVGVLGMGVTAVVWRVGPAGVAATIGVVMALITAVVVLSGMLVPQRRHRVYRWSLYPDGVVVRSGWLWQETTIVPHVRIQAVDAQSGPLERAAGLASVHIRTASVAGSPRIPGLDVNAADELAALIAERAGVEDAT